MPCKSACVHLQPQLVCDKLRLKSAVITSMAASRALLQHFQSRSNAVPAATGITLELHWNRRRWSETGARLERDWNTGTELESGTGLERHWSGAGTRLS
jgi:hypothetical protein